MQFKGRPLVFQFTEPTLYVTVPPCQEKPA
jgi:hypothetical protein